MTGSFARGAPAPMEGQGAYNRSSRVQAAGLSSAIPLFGEAAKAVPLAPAPEPIVVADYGCSEGHNSLAPMAEAIHALRSRTGPERAIQVVHTDLPNNDFSGLFETLQSDPDSYLHGQTAMFASAVGESFYDQLLPSGTVTLGWSSWSVHWLSRTPAIIPDHLQVAYSKDAAARAAYEKQGADDWRAFLVHRGQELRPGGRLVVLTMARTDAGDFGYRSVLDAMMGALADLVQKGLITQNEVDRMSIPTVGRTRAELAAPFGTSGSFAGLSLLSVELFLALDHIWEDFERDGDARQFGARWAAFVRASAFPTLALSLDGGANDPRAAQFFQEMEMRVASRMAASPEKNDMPLAKVAIEKATA